MANGCCSGGVIQLSPLFLVDVLANSVDYLTMLFGFTFYKIAMCAWCTSSLDNPILAVCWYLLCNFSLIGVSGWSLSE